MALKDMLSLCGRIGLIVAAFMLVAGIVAGPLLERVWLSRLTVTERSDRPVPPAANPPSERQPGKQG